MHNSGCPLKLATIVLVFCVLFGCVIAEPASDSIGDLPGDILGQLLALGLPVNSIDLFLSVLGLLVGSASMDFNITNPLPLIEITIDQASMQLGQNGTTFFTFNQTFTDFIIPGLGSANSGRINDVALTQGGLATLPLLQATSLDIIEANYSLRILTTNGTGGVALLLNTIQQGVPTDTSVQLLKE